MVVLTRGLAKSIRILRFIDNRLIALKLKKSNPCSVTIKALSHVPIVPLFNRTLLPN